MHQKKIFAAGKSLNEAEKALVMVHGRGAFAEDILSLAGYFNIKDYALLAPQATNNTWYPYSFLTPPQQNEPWLSSALNILKQVEADILAAGISSNNIYFLGFSQGACLMLEFITRYAKKRGGAVAFTGGLVGDKIYKENYSGDFLQMPVFIGSSDPDVHVPVERVRETVTVLKNMHADVTVKIYPSMGHTISTDEIEKANTLIFK
ncbi:alpha/beta hydrolase [Parafilimonas terrae]|uniref:Phospholipase/carboxylesterase n=1 Tax=Parafilimonas terrae TaxID=1465490 RepID=A0A1I5W8W6_9BACT|nr:dienelactone hydrolase family protein [Parafilimonas terrae]SFQ16190.1 phospholipase/carboxylesterase [Parafilimonas terrae]